jgi:predicted MFS family arabinose efflux permease
MKLMRARIWLGILIGSAIGGFIPDLWGADFFSYTSVLLSGVGGLAGLWLGYKMS